MALVNLAVAADRGQDLLITLAASSSLDTLVGATVYWRAYRQEHGVPLPGVDPVLAKVSPSGGIVVLDSPPMTFRLTLTDSDIVDLLRNYYYEVLVISASGIKSDPQSGILTVTQTENRLAP